MNYSKKHVKHLATIYAQLDYNSEVVFTRKVINANFHYWYKYLTDEIKFIAHCDVCFRKQKRR